MRRADPIAELLGSSSRVAAVQRVLSEFGYGQIKPSGILDEATSTAIERFEREHKLPVTGLLSDRLVRELASMSGRPLD
jgi:peptidoglycan hydrolase-like protein with peptidoglycan-binding domain